MAPTTTAASLLVETMPSLPLQYHDIACDGDDKPSPTVTHHEEYYFEDGNLVLQVENTLFKVFRSTFTRHSSTFSDMFDLPPTCQKGGVEGSSDWNPILLTGISVTDFERLLWILYPPTYGVHRARTADEWTSILDLATRWEFTAIRELAIRSLQTLKIPPADCIALCQKYDIASNWTLAAYVALCERPEPLTIHEANQLGLEAVVRIAQIRERLRATNSITSYRSPTRSATRRAEMGSVRPRPTARTERLQWDIGRSFLDQSHIPLSQVPSHKPRSAASKASRPMLSRSARLVAESFEQLSTSKLYR